MFIFCQVHPFKLATKFVSEAKRLANTEVVIGSVSDVIQHEGRVTAVKVDGKVIPADVVVMAMGPWSYKACAWFDVPVIKGGRAHSVVLKQKSESSNPITAHCLFTDYRGRKLSGEPELYPRPDGTVYACGFSDDVAMPDDAKDVKPNKQSCAALKDICAQISTELADSDVIAEQACYLPTPQGRSGPVIGKIANVENAYIAAGHTCWGILNAPATGKAIAELILDGECSFLDLSPFAPK